MNSNPALPSASYAPPPILRVDPSLVRLSSFPTPGFLPYPYYPAPYFFPFVQQRRPIPVVGPIVRPALSATTNDTEADAASTLAFDTVAAAIPRISSRIASSKVVKKYRKSVLKSVTPGGRQPTLPAEQQPPTLGTTGNAITRCDRTALGLVHRDLFKQSSPEKHSFKCEWNDCTMIFSAERALCNHLQDAHTLKSEDFVCMWAECSRERRPFTANYQLLIHLRSHTGEKPFTCGHPGCDRRYSRLENLKAHERVHTGQKPYKCDSPGCTRAFTNASDRAKHQNRVHSDAKPFACPVEECVKSYTDPSSLRKHMKASHGEEAWEVARLNKQRNGRNGTHGFVPAILNGVDVRCKDCCAKASPPDGAASGTPSSVDVATESSDDDEEIDVEGDIGSLEDPSTQPSVVGDEGTASEKNAESRMEDLLDPCVQETARECVTKLIAAASQDAPSTQQCTMYANGPQLLSNLNAVLTDLNISMKRLIEKAGEARARSVDFKENAGSGEEATSSD